MQCHEPASLSGRFIPQPYPLWISHEGVDGDTFTSLVIGWSVETQRGDDGIAFDRISPVLAEPTGGFGVCDARDLIFPGDNPPWYHLRVPQG